MISTSASRRSRVAAGLLLLLSVGACSSTSRTGEPATSPDADLEEIYRARKEAERLRFSDADVDFMTGMISHHAQALVMAALAPTHGASNEVQTLAARIINAQKDEIATMQEWLRVRGRPAPEIHFDGLELMVHGGHAMHMPGMLTREQLRELDAARSTDFDRLFLTYMIQHHKGAVTMVHDLFATDGAAQGEQTFKLASDIQVDQITEIDRMGRMLSELSDQD